MKEPTPEPLSLPAPPVQKRELFGWCCYDFANSAYTTIIITVVFSPYFTLVIGRGEDWAIGAWGWMVAISQLVVLLLSPGLGILADIQAAKKHYLLATTILCSLCTIALAATGPGTLMLAATLLILSNVAYSLGENLCAGFLPEISTSKNCGRISGYGWSFGYCGGLISLGIALLIIQTLGAGEFTSRMIFIMTGLFFLISSLPTFLFLKERKTPATGTPTAQAFLRAARKQRHLAGELMNHPVLFRFFISFLCFMAGIYAVIAYASIYAGQELNFTQTELIGLFALLQLSSAVGAFAFGYFQDRVGPKRVLSLSLLLWIVVCVAAALCPSKAWFFAVGNLAGLGIGATQSTSRAVVSLLAPSEKSGEFFGFWGSFGKLAAIIGPLTFGLSASWLGMRPAISILSLFFLAGLLILFRIPLNMPSRESR